MGPELVAGEVVETGWRRGQVVQNDTALGAAIRRPTAAGNCFTGMLECKTRPGFRKLEATRVIESPAVTHIRYGGAK